MVYFRGDRLFAVSSAIFAVVGIAQLIVAFVDPLPLPIVQQVVPTSSLIFAATLFVVWVLGFAIFVVAVTRAVMRRRIS